MWISKKITEIREVRYSKYTPNLDFHFSRPQVSFLGSVETQKSNMAAFLHALRLVNLHLSFLTSCKPSESKLSSFTRVSVWVS